MPIKGLVKKGDAMFVTAPKIEVYIENYYFNGINSYDDNKVIVFGLFVFKVFDSLNKSPDKVELKSMILPAKMVMIPSNHYKKSMVVDGIHEENYVVLEFFKGDVFMESLNLIQDIENVEKVLDLFLKSKFPYGIPYDKLSNIFIQGFIVNKQKLNVPASLFEAMIAVFYRNPKDHGQMFRHSDNRNMYNYVKVTDKVVVLDNNASAMSYEDADQMIIKTVNKTRKNIPDKYSPVEEFNKV